MVNRRQLPRRFPVRIALCLFLAALSLTLAVAVPTLSSPAASSITEDAAQDAYAASYRYEQTQNYPDAIKALLVISDPEYLTKLRLGWLYYLNGNFANSEKFYQAAMADAPQAIDPRLGYMLPLLAQERYADVEAVARQVLMRDSHNYYASLRLIIALRLQGKLPQAEETANDMLVLYPTDVGLLTQAGLIYAAERNSLAARRTFRRVLKLDPENTTAKQQLKSSVN